MKDLERDRKMEIIVDEIAIKIYVFYTTIVKFIRIIISQLPTFVYPSVYLMDLKRSLNLRDESF